MVRFGETKTTERYALKPVRCGFSCHLITLERAMRHPALAVMAAESKTVFESRKIPRRA